MGYLRSLGSWEDLSVLALMLLVSWRKPAAACKAISVHSLKNLLDMSKEMMDSNDFLHMFPSFCHDFVCFLVYRILGYVRVEALASRQLSESGLAAKRRGVVRGKGAT